MKLTFNAFDELTSEEKETITNCPPLMAQAKEVEALYLKYVKNEISKEEFMELVMDMLDINEIEKNLEGIVLRDKILTAINSMIAIAKMM